MKDLQETLNENSLFFQRQEQTIVARLAMLPKGNVKAKKIGKEIFYYLQYRQGDSVKSDYIGKQVPKDMKQKVAERKRLEKELQQTRNALKILRVKKNNETDLAEPLRSILKKLTTEKLWDAGLEIIGSWCFLLYQKYLPLDKYPLKTQDLDILIPIPYRGKPFDFYNYLKQLGFIENFNPDGSIFFTGNVMKIEFLGPERGDGLKPPRHIKEISVTPQLLRYMEILFEEPLVLKVAKGIKAKVPAPATFTLHKLIISTHFRRSGKKEKDIRQAVCTGKYTLHEKSEIKKLLRMWEHLPESWKRKIHRALDEAIHIVPLEQNVIHRLQAILT